MKTIYAIYFSPCGNVKTIIETMVETAKDCLEIDKVEVIDFTLPAAREKVYEIEKDAIVFFGSPVYAGRIPNKIAPFIEHHFIGNGAITIPIVSFGNRNYDNALIELKLLLEKNNFKVVSAAAIVSNHSFSDTLAYGRPNIEDKKQIQQFVVDSIKVAKEWDKERELCLSVPGDNPPTTYYTPLGKDLKPATFLKAKPLVKQEACIDCLVCVNACPMASISMDTKETIGICIKCHACIRKCTQKARYFDDEAFLSHKEMLEENYTREIESTFILPKIK